MKRILPLMILASAAASAAFGAAPPAKPGFQVAIVTGPRSEARDACLGVDALVKAYGDAEAGGMVRHVALPEPAAGREEWLAPRLLELVADPFLKAVVFNAPVNGLPVLAKRLRAARPELLIVAADAWDDPLVLQNAVDLAVNVDSVSRGYLLAWMARQLGAKTFVHLSFPRHLGFAAVESRLEALRAAAAEFGLAFAEETVPDPRVSGLQTGAKALAAKFPEWAARHGKAAAYFCTEDGYAETLVRLVLEKGGVFPEANLPSPGVGFPAALGLPTEISDAGYPLLLKKVDTALVARGGAGRFGTWAFPAAYAFSAGLGDFAKSVVEGKARAESVKDLVAALGRYTPGATWAGASYRDPATGARARGQVMVFMDTYVFGRGYLGTLKQAVPERFLRIGATD